MKEDTKRVMYQKTFTGRSADTVDKVANAFREDPSIRAMYTQTHVFIDGISAVFVTIVFYTKK